MVYICLVKNPRKVVSVSAHSASSGARRRTSFRWRSAGRCGAWRERAERDVTQYSYRNTLVAANTGSRFVVVLVSCPAILKHPRVRMLPNTLAGHIVRDYIPSGIAGLFSVQRGYFRPESDIGKIVSSISEWHCHLLSIVT